MGQGNPLPFFSRMARQPRFDYAGAYDVDLSVDSKAVVEQLNKLLYDKIVKTKDIRALYRRVVAPVKKAVQEKFLATVKEDPRNTYKAVRIITLKRGAGVVVGLLNPRKAGAPGTYVKKRGGRSGIIRRRERSKRTIQVDGYRGADRAWLMRIVNQGTVNGPRKAGTRGTLKKPANRGELSAKKFFMAGEQAMKTAEKTFIEEIKKIIEKTSKE